jgi:hypothetical protein
LVDKDRVIVQEKVKIYGNITPPNSSTIAIQVITSENAPEMNSLWDNLGETSSKIDGSYQYYWVPARPGTFWIRSHLALEGVYSEPVQLRVVMRSNISLVIGPEQPSRGDEIRLFGSVFPPRQITIMIGITCPNGSVSVCEIKTDSLGLFSWRTTADITGIWKIEARYPGDKLHSDGIVHGQIEVKTSFLREMTLLMREVLIFPRTNPLTATALFWLVLISVVLLLRVTRKPSLHKIKSVELVKPSLNSELRNLYEAGILSPEDFLEARIRLEDMERSDISVAESHDIDTVSSNAKKLFEEGYINQETLDKLLMKLKRLKKPKTQD